MAKIMKLDDRHMNGVAGGYTFDEVDSEPGVRYVAVPTVVGEKITYHGTDGRTAVLTAVERDGMLDWIPEHYGQVIEGRRRGLGGTTLFIPQGASVEDVAGNRFDSNLHRI
jgi:hypothetical protein